MLNSNTIKYIGYLREEVQLYEWWENNKPNKEIDYEEGIKSVSPYTSGFVSHYALLSSFDPNNTDFSNKADFSNALTGSDYNSIADSLFIWIDNLSEDKKKKACLYLAKMQNKGKLDKNSASIGNSTYKRNAWFANYPTELTDFNSLPLTDIFIDASDLRVSEISKDSAYGFLDFSVNHSVYKLIYNDLNSKNSEAVLKWILLPNESGDVSIQITPYSYTQVGNPLLKDERSSSLLSGVDIFQDVIAFKDGVATKANVDSEKYFDDIEPLEKYALNIQKNSTLSIEGISIDIMLDRAYSASKVSKSFTNPYELTDKSISFKLIFDIETQKSVIVPSVDLCQSLLYLKSMGSEDVSLYYDEYSKRVVIKGENFKGQKEIETARSKGSRLKKTEFVDVEIPTFSIIYEQPISDLTSFAVIEYVQFFNKELSFRDKYDLLNTKSNAPLVLTEEFKKDYPFVSSQYFQQVSVAFSLKGREDKFNYVKKVAENYLDSYTESEKRYKVSDKSGSWSGKWSTDNSNTLDGSEKSFRKTIVSEKWDELDYVLQVQEAYWEYNDSISVDELLSFFISKGNSVGYRALSMKILGVDYHIFEQSIINGLLDSNNIYISKMSIDEKNITADVQYQSYNEFVSGNIYKKYDNFNQKDAQGENATIKNLNVFFGNELGATIYDMSLSTINDAIENRHIPTLVPNVADEALAASLELNVDIYSSIFFKGTHPELTNSGQVAKKAFDNLLSTGYRAILELETLTTGKSSIFAYGHFELFKNWLELNKSQILGFNSEEIIDAYVFPKQQDYYIYNYVLPTYQNKAEEVVGYTTNGRGKLIDLVKNADAVTRLTLKSKGTIKDSDTITPKEAKVISNELRLLFRERFWEARREGRRLFNYFLRKSLTVESQNRIDLAWNTSFNNYAKPDLLKVPIFPTHSYKFGKRKESNKLVLAEAQKEGVRHVISRKNSGLFLHEVGFGKTTSSITAVSSMMNTGEASRALFLVPNSVYDKFQDEIVGNSEQIGLLPNVNIVLLDNLSATTLKSSKSNNGNGLKEFTVKEKELMDDFKVFARNFAMPKKSESGETPKHIGNQCRIFSKLRRHRVTLENDPEFTSTSDWAAAYGLIESALKKEVKSSNNDIVLEHLKEVQSIYKLIDSEWQQKYEELDGVSNDYSKSQNDRAKSESQIEKLAITYSTKLSKMLNQYIRFATLSLVDDLGYYKSQVMEQKTILIAKHSAVSQLRPSTDGTMRALLFKEGKGEPKSLPETLNLAEWADATGEDANTRLTQQKVKVAVKVLSSHPVSYAKLNIDTLVIDEIHNFNNIVNRAGAKGIISSDGSGNDYYEGDRRDANSLRARRYPLLPESGRAEGTYVMKYDSTGRGSDGNGTKLTAAALCFDIQNKETDVNNVMLLSATPFTDTPFQVLSVLGMSNYDMLMDNGITSAWDFFNNYVDELYKYDLKHDGGYGLFIDINGYYNDKALSNLITNVANVKITDEKIEANRPKKAIIPANKVKKLSDGKSSTASQQMGDQFRELEFCNSRVSLSEDQEKFQSIIKDYLSDDDNQQKVSEIFPINEQRRNKKGLTAEEEAVLDEDLKKLMDEKISEAKRDTDNADLVINILDDMYNRSPQYKMHPLIKKTIDNINKAVFNIQPEVDEDDLSDVSADVSQMSAVQKLAGKAISCQQAQTSLVLSPYMINLGDASYTSKFLKPLEPNPSKVFVESSPKLMFVVKCIRQAIKYQQEQIKKGLLEKIGGQVVYFHKHNFQYGGNSYNAFDLLSEYIAENVDEISSEKDSLGNYIEIAKISGDTKIDDQFKNLPKSLKSNKLTSEQIEERKSYLSQKGRKSIKDEFNDGTIKVLLGSKAIKEGIDLQGNSHTMYICEAEFSPEVAMQLEGRIWRQKNPYDVVRVVYVLAMNTIDSFIYSKINRKVTMIKRMLELGVYEMGTTQFVVDTKEMLIQLESDPDKLTAIQFQDEIKILKQKVDRKQKIMSRLELLKSDWAFDGTGISVKYASAIENVSKLYKLFGEARKESKKNGKGGFRSIITKELSSQKKADWEEAKDKGYKKSFPEWFKTLKDIQQTKYQPTDKQVEEYYQKELSQNPSINPFPNWENINLSIDTPFTELALAAQKIRKNLKTAATLEKTWRAANTEGQETLRNRENAPVGHSLYIAYTDVTGTTDVEAYEESLMRNFETNVKDINAIKDYHSYILNNEDVNGIEDIQSVIDKEGQEYFLAKAAIDDRPKFRADLRAKWVTALEKRVETFGGTLDDLVDTMSASLPLIKLRKNIK